MVVTPAPAQVPTQRPLVSNFTSIERWLELFTLPSYYFCWLIVSKHSTSTILVFHCSGQEVNFFHSPTLILNANILFYSLHNLRSIWSTSVISLFPCKPLSFQVDFGFRRFLLAEGTQLKSYLYPVLSWCTQTVQIPFINFYNSQQYRLSSVLLLFINSWRSFTSLKAHSAEFFNSWYVSTADVLCLFTVNKSIMDVKSKRNSLLCILFYNKTRNNFLVASP